ncbi:CrcB-like protein-domain-containing protein [Fimicolochytrium jonesii]|uniref:CrcB-like protein-domain-containing protein n=1 Tax=Fimicolochytrium jonesii TaxID=1396493 RepID=UPI0022FF3C38|nr:CrcB-like protein-domain-containing protein [Fimicolochytrium jonesii]KAI8821317.1 CrcB-like protein-domain-containing protein [Fimicolochytrium jonesii]
MPIAPPPPAESTASHESFDVIDGADSSGARDNSHQNDRDPWIPQTYHPAPLHALLVLLSIVGVLIRVGLLRLHDYAGAPVSNVVYPQIVGCVVMGWLAGNKRAIMEWYASETGFALLRVWVNDVGCDPVYGYAVRSPPSQSTLAPIESNILKDVDPPPGSITTFSTWSLATFTELANLQTKPRTVGQDILAALAITLLLTCLALSSIAFGEHLATLPALSLPIPSPSRRDIKFVPTRWGDTKSLHARDLCVLACGAVVWLAVAVACAKDTGGRVNGFAALVGPFGTLLRFHLTPLNARTPVPLGTFVANVAGTALIGGSYVVSHLTRSVSPTCCAFVVGGLMTGFCGCLTTVSTWAVEVRGLVAVGEGGKAYGYVGASVVGGLGVLGVLVGSVWWAGGVVEVGQCAVT